MSINEAAVAVENASRVLLDAIAALSDAYFDNQDDLNANFVAEVWEDVDQLMYELNCVVRN